MRLRTWSATNWFCLYAQSLLLLSHKKCLLAKRIAIGILLACNKHLLVAFKGWWDLFQIELLSHSFIRLNIRTCWQCKFETLAVSSCYRWCFDFKHMTLWLLIFFRLHFKVAVKPLLLDLKVILSKESELTINKMCLINIKASCTNNEAL